MSRVYLLGGHQTDFKRNFAREGKGIFEILKEPVEGALAATGIEPEEIEVAHIGNFVAELFCRQGQLGGLFAAIHPRFSGLPASRHEGACASGSLAALAAQADIKAGHYDLACVAGVEMRQAGAGFARPFIEAVCRHDWRRASREGRPGGQRDVIGGVQRTRECHSVRRTGRFNGAI